MANTKFQDVYDSFEATFADKIEIPESLEAQWLKMSVARWNNELATDEPLEIDDDLQEFTSEIDQYKIDTIGAMMKEYYVQRTVSRMNKIASIVGKDLSVNSGMSLSKYANIELQDVKNDVSDMVNNQKTVSYK